MRPIHILPLVIALAFVPAAQAQESLTVTMHDDYFEIDGQDGQNPDLFLEPGTTYEITVRNEGSRDHNFNIPDLGLDPDSSSSGLMAPGAEQTVTVEVPEDQAGTAEYWCDPHKSVGMRGVVTFSQTERDTPGLGLPVLLGVLAGLGLALRRRG